MLSKHHASATLMQGHDLVVGTEPSVDGKRSLLEDCAGKRRAGKIKALQQVDTALERDTQMLGVLDAFDQHLGAALVQHRHQRSEEAFGGGMPAEIGEPGAVDLDDVGRQK